MFDLYIALRRHSGLFLILCAIKVGEAGKDEIITARKRCLYAEPIVATTTFYRLLPQLPRPVSVYPCVNGFVDIAFRRYLAGSRSLFFSVTLMTMVHGH